MLAQEPSSRSHSGRVWGGEGFGGMRGVVGELGREVYAEGEGVLSRSYSRLRVPEPYLYLYLYLCPYRVEEKDYALSSVNACLSWGWDLRSK